MKLFRCKFFELEYDDLGKYPYCESKDIRSRMCINPTDMTAAQQFCPCYEQGDYVGNVKVSEKELTEYKTKINEAYSKYESKK